MKKTLSLFMTAAVLLMNMICGTAVSAADPPEYEEASAIEDKLNRFGILFENDLEPDDLMTKGSFTAAVLKLMNIDVMSGSTVFSDVDEKTPYYDEIYTAYAVGLITDDGSGRFNPYENIKYNEALKILVTAFGHAPAAENSGGYPDGYISEAQQIKITLSEYRGGVSYIGMLRMMNNLKTVRVPIETSVSGGNINYSFKNVDFLEQYHDIYEGEGMVTAAEGIDLYGSSSLKESFTDIGGTRYECSFPNMLDLLGCNVKYWYYDDKDTQTVVYAELTSKNTILDISAEDLIGFKDNAYSYYKNGKSSANARVTDNCFILYNRRLLNEKDDKLLVPDIGKVRLISTTGSTIYDVVIVEAYENYVVETVDVENCIIYDKFDTSKTLCYDEGKGIDAKFVTFNGKDVFAGVISEWSVITALVSNDGKYVYAILSVDSVSGRVDSISATGDDKNIVIDGTEYKISRNADAEILSEVKLGTSVICHMDIFGKVAAVSNGIGTDYEYYVMLKVKPGETDLDANKVKVMDKNNVISDHVLPIDAKIDRKKYKTPDKQYEMLCSALETGYIVRMRFENGEISDIDTPYISSSESEGSSLSVMLPKTGNLLFKNTNSVGNLGDKLYVSKTNVFAVFEYPSETEYEDRFLIGDYNSFTNDTSYTAQVFRMEDTFEPPAILVQPNDLSARTVTDRNIYAVSEITEAIDPRDNVTHCYRLMATNGSVTKELYLTNEQYEHVEGLNRGDVFRADIFKENYVLGKFIEKLYDFEKDKIVAQNMPSVGINKPIAMAEGYVYKKLGAYISLAPVDSIADIESSEKYVGAIPANIIKITNERGKVTVKKASAVDLKGYVSVGSNCSKVIVKYQYKAPYDIIIIDPD